jgi:hypothetical protein
MTEFALTFAREQWHALAEASPLVLVGFLAAGLLKALLPEDAIARQLEENSTKAVITASLIGMPAPLFVRSDPRSCQLTSEVSQPWIVGSVYGINTRIRG